MGIVDALPFGRHKKIERFALVLCASVACIAVALGAALVQLAKDSAATLSDQAVYTTDFRTSRTGIKGTVEGVWGSTDARRGFLLVKMEGMSMLSTDANDYALWLTARDADGTVRPMKKAVAASWYVFGTTGYMGAYLVCDEGFGGEVVDLVVESKKELSSASAPSSVEAGDEAMLERDMYRVCWNPGATMAQRAECLEGDGAPSVTDLYSQCVLIEEEEEQKAKIEDKVEELRVGLVQIAEYERRLEEVYGLAAPEEPELVAGDWIMSKDDRQVLSTDTNAVGSIDIDWSGRTVEDGWLSELLEDGQTKSEWLASWVASYGSGPSKSKDTDVEMPSTGALDTPIAEWAMASGGTLVDSDLGDSSLGSYSEAVGECQRLTKAWKDYIADKQELQTTMMKDLIALEVRRDEVASQASVAAGDGLLVVY